MDQAVIPEVENTEGRKPQKCTLLARFSIQIYINTNIIKSLNDINMTVAPGQKLTWDVVELVRGDREVGEVW